MAKKAKAKKKTGKKKAAPVRKKKKTMKTAKKAAPKKTAKKAAPKRKAPAHKPAAPAVAPMPAAARLGWFRGGRVKTGETRSKMPWMRSPLNSAISTASVLCPTGRPPSRNSARFN